MKKLGEILVTQGTVSDADVETALSDQSAGEPTRLGDLLVSTGKLSAAQLGQALAEQYRLPFVDLPRLPPSVLELVPLDLQRQFRFVPLKAEGSELSVAMADLSTIEVLAILEQQWTKVHVHVAGGDEIDALHATLTGALTLPGDELPKVAPSISPLGEGESLVSNRVPTPPEMTSVSRPVGSAPLAEDLFGDLNLESGRTGISARSDLFPESPAEPMQPELTASVVVDATPDSTAPVDGSSETPLTADAELFSEGSGVVDLFTDGGTGPVIDTPFFRDQVKNEAPPLSAAPFRSSASSVAMGSSEPNAVAMVLPVAAGHAAAGWLSEEESRASAASESQGAGGQNGWTGALEHLMPSKLVLGLTRALLARGIVTEQDILAALGEKK